MGLLTNFFVSALIKFLEQEFLSQERDLQQQFLNEVNSFVSAVTHWINEKLGNDEEPQGEDHDEEKGNEEND